MRMATWVLLSKRPFGRMQLTSVLAVLLLASTVACSGNPLEPSRSIFAITVHAEDAISVLQPRGGPVPLEGVRVEILNGPKAGVVVATDAAGDYRLLDLPGVPMTFRATKDGYDPCSVTFTPGATFGLAGLPALTLNFVLGRPPHALWGTTEQPTVANPRITLADVRIEILDGANAGKVTFSDAAGSFRFDGLVVSQKFSIVLTKTGYRAVTYPIDGGCFPLVCDFFHRSRDVGRLYLQAAP